MNSFLLDFKLHSAAFRRVSLQCSEAQVQNIWFIHCCTGKQAHHKHIFTLADKCFFPLSDQIIFSFKRTLLLNSEGTTPIILFSLFYLFIFQNCKSSPGRFLGACRHASGKLLSVQLVLLRGLKTKFHLPGKIHSKMKETPQMKTQ